MENKFKVDDFVIVLKDITEYSVGIITEVSELTDGTLLYIIENFNSIFEEKAFEEELLPLTSEILSKLRKIKQEYAIKNNEAANFLVDETIKLKKLYGK